MKGVCLTCLQAAGVYLTAIILSCLFHLFVAVADAEGWWCYAGVLFYPELSNLRMKSMGKYSFKKMLFYKKNVKYRMNKKGIFGCILQPKDAYFILLNFRPKSLSFLPPFGRIFTHDEKATLLRIIGDNRVWLVLWLFNNFTSTKM